MMGIHIGGIHPDATDPESKSNSYTFRCMTITIVFVTLMLVFNLLGLFIIEQNIMIKTFAFIFVLYVISFVVYRRVDRSKPWVKYFLLTMAILITTVFSMYLTYHALLAALFPIVYATLYSSKRVMTYTYLLTVIEIAFAVYGGFYYGVCDANMIFLTNQTLSAYVNEAGEFLGQAANPNVPLTLGMFYVLPRCMLALAFAIICNSVRQIIKENVQYAREMKNLAEIDGMTGVYNRTCYLEDLDRYHSVDHIGVFFFDANELKMVNDVQGHEKGDELIRRIADSLKKAFGNVAKIYRIGGDEFVVVAENPDKEDMLDHYATWKQMSVPVSSGYAFGRGKELDALMQEADRAMYQDKQQYRERKGRSEVN